MFFATSTYASCVPDLNQTLAELGRTLPSQTITVSDVNGLINAVNQVNAVGGNRTILLEDGEYNFEGSRLYISVDNVAIRSVFGDRDRVKILGTGMNGGFQQVFEVAGDYFTLADVTIGNVRNHPVQIHGENNADYPLIHNVRFIDAGEQMLKVSYNSSDPDSSDNGVVEWCLFEYTAGIGPRYYIGGIDAHRAHNWIVRNNVFRDIRSPDSGLAEHAVHFWSESSNTLVEKNLITNCDRGIGFGLGSAGHNGGIIRNNMVHTTRDVSIGLENSDNTLVYNNTVYTENYSMSIEYRFSGTNGGSIINNLTNENISSRNGGSAIVANNITSAQASWFIDPSNGDLHLATPVSSVVDQGQTLSDVTQDFDCEARPQGAYDIGADEIGGSTDTDEDGVIDDIDNCPNTPNTDQADVDADGVGDACDVCPNDPANDSDQDAVCGDVDNCPNTPNTDQADSDGDGVGDACEGDADEDGFSNLVEAQVKNPIPEPSTVIFFSTGLLGMFLLTRKRYGKKK